MSLEAQVAKHFEQRLEWSELKRLIAEALDESKEYKAPEEVKPFLDTTLQMLKKFFKDNKKEPAFKPAGSSRNVTTFENTGNAVMRNKFMQELKAWADSQDEMEFELTVPYSSPDLGFIGGTITVGEVSHKVVLKKGSGGSGGNVATQFEGNIIVGIYNVTGREAEGQKLKDALLSTNDIVNDEAYQNKANEVASALVKKGQSRGFKFGEVGSSSGGKVKASLTTTYLNHGVKSKEAKADVSISEVGVSVKKLEESQFVAAQGPELAAIFDVAMKANRELSSEMEQNVDQFIDRLQRAVGTAEKAHAKDKDTPMIKDPKTGKMVPNMQKGQADFYGARDQFSTTNDAGKVDNTPYQKLLNKFLDLSKGGFDQVSDEEKEKLSAATSTFQKEGEKDFVELREEVGEILKSDLFKVEVVRECVTGNGKFNEEEPRAKAILKWSMNEPAKSDFIIFNEQWFQQAAQGAKLEIRDRGNKRGGSMRGEFDKVQEEYDIFSDPELEFTAEELEEINSNTKILCERYVKDEQMIYMLLTEVDWAGMAGKAWNATKQGASWVANKVKGLIKSFAEAVSKIGAWIKKVIGKGFSYLAKFLGFEPVSVEIQI